VFALFAIGREDIVTPDFMQPKKDLKVENRLKSIG
jgi:hypothetical protein